MSVAAAKVTRPTRSLLGKPRQSGDLLSQEEVSSIEPHVLKALVNGGKIELFTKSISKEHEGFDQRLQIVEAKLEDLLNGNTGAVAKTAAPAKKRAGRPRGSKNKSKE